MCEPSRIDRVGRRVAVLALAALAAVGVPGTEGEVRVTDSGVGTAVVERELEGRADRFAEGTKVWFWTRVADGAGQSVRHVWLHEGRERHVFDSRPRSADWRTWSNKMLHPGSTGAWVVEARDENDRVLARQEFRCEPPDPEAPGQQ
jgi:hypothetical protein